MRLQSAVVVAFSCSVLLVGRAGGDDLKINTPVVSANLRGNWELQPRAAAEYKQTLHLGPQFTGEWQQSRESLPTSIAWFVEGGELRILHYYEPAGESRADAPGPVQTGGRHAHAYIDGKPTAWKRIKDDASARP